MNGHYFIACYSGGKDSTAMLHHLVKNRHPLDEIVYCRDPFPHGYRLMYKYFKYIEKKVNVKITILKLKFLSIIDQIGVIPKLPHPYCVHYKIGTLIQYIKKKYGDTNVTLYLGIRKYESDTRNNYEYNEWGQPYYFNEKYKVYYLSEYPLYKMKDPRKYLDKHNIELNPLYERYNLERLSCKYCVKIHWKEIFCNFLDKHNNDIRVKNI